MTLHIVIVNKHLKFHIYKTRMYVPPATPTLEVTEKFYLQKCIKNGVFVVPYNKIPEFPNETSRQL